MALGHSALKRISPDLATPISVSIGKYSSVDWWRIMVGVGLPGVVKAIGGILVGVTITAGVGI